MKRAEDERRTQTNARAVAARRRRVPAAAARPRRRVRNRAAWPRTTCVLNTLLADSNENVVQFAAMAAQQIGPEAAAPTRWVEAWLSRLPCHTVTVWVLPEPTAQASRWP